MEEKIKYFISNYFQKRKQKKNDQTDMDEISFMTKKYGDVFYFIYSYSFYLNP